jgi:predicted AAA+ superfamily ATPase
MIDRVLYSSITGAIARNPVVAIVGPRQVGKTTLARQIAAQDGRSLYLDLELPSDANKLRDAELYLDGLRDRLVIIDEVQRMPALFPLLRALVDRDRHPGRFLLLGSSSPELMRRTSESLAGRIRYFELSPLCLSETGTELLRLLWLRGGYPPSLLAAGDAESIDWRRSFIATYLERDIPQLGIRVPAGQLRRFWTMLAHLHGQLWNASRIAASMELSAPTIQRYLDILEDTFIVRQLRPYLTNVGKRIVKSPKVYIRDSGLVHALLGIEVGEDLAAHPALGASWEGFVISQILSVMPDGWQAFNYRTGAGAEVDLVLLDRRQVVTAVEIKYSSAPQPPKGFRIACNDLACQRRFILYPGTERYPLPGGTTAVPVGEIAALFEP